MLTCGGVSYAHGSNDGQKGMGLIMLILVGTVPTAYALNHAMGANQVQTFAAVSTQVAGVLDHYVDAKTAPQDAGPELEKFITTKQYEPGVMVALRDMVTDIRDEAVCVWDPGERAAGNARECAQPDVSDQRDAAIDGEERRTGDAGSRT